MSDFKIFNMPEIPPPPPTGNRVSKYPFEKLEVGQGFDIAADRMSKRNAEVLVSRWGSKLKMKFRFGWFAEGENPSVGIVRFWREA